MLLLAAAALPRARRDGLLRGVASHLGRRNEIDDGDLLLAINEALHQWRSVRVPARTTNY